MFRDPEKLRDQAAGPTLQRIRDDRKRVSEKLVSVLEELEISLFDAPLTASKLLKKSSLSQSRASLRFAEEVGATPWYYVFDCRMTVVAELLVSTEIAVRKIGELVGYPNLDTFSKAFERWSKLTPTAYRKTYRVNAGAGDGSQLEQSRELEELMESVERATAAGDVRNARHHLSRADAILRDQDIRDRALRLALDCHERGAVLTYDSDVDRAYRDLDLARLCYGMAGKRPPATPERRPHLSVSCVTDEALAAALCPDCRARLNGDEGRTLRLHLRQALLPIPRDLPWFGASCDDCYRVVWRAICHARLGLMNDAWKAYWLSIHADPYDRETPPSRGRVIAALAEVVDRVFGDQLERKAFCDLAIEDAVAIGDPWLEAEARIWLGSVLRAMTEFFDAREEFQRTVEASRATPWLSALHSRMEGILADHTNDYARALELYRSANAFYETSDPHVAGLVLIQEANVHFWLTEYDESIALLKRSLSLLDERRDPLPTNATVPVHLAASYALSGRWEEAESALLTCSFDRDANPGVAGSEVLTRACLELLRGRSHASLPLFEEAQERFEKLHRPRSVALAASYSLGAHARAGDHAGAIKTAASALSFFQAAGCPQDTLQLVVAGGSLPRL